MNKYIFTSESVSNGHPDKVADQISNALVDAGLKAGDETTRVAVETLVTTNHVTLAGGVKEPTSIYVDSNGHNRNIERFIRNSIDLTPKGIIDRFNLFKYTKYSENCVYGHFGNKDVPWEKIGW